MRSSAIIRSAVLVLAAFLVIDASWCCDEMITMQPSSMVLLTSAIDGCGDDAGPLDCHSCICSGLALVELNPTHAPPLVSAELIALVAGAPVSEITSIDVPPDKRC